MRRSRTTVEILVTTADCGIDVAPLEIQGDCAGTMGQIPDGDRSSTMSPLRYKGHVVHPCGAIIDVRQTNHGDVIINRVDQVLGSNPPHNGFGKQRGSTLGYVQIGRKIPRFGENDFRSGPLPEETDEQFEQVDRHAVGKHDVGCGNAEQWRQSSTQATGSPKPAGFIPAANQSPAPLLLGHVLHCARAALHSGPRLLPSR